MSIDTRMSVMRSLYDKPCNGCQSPTADLGQLYVRTPGGSWWVFCRRCTASIMGAANSMYKLMDTAEVVVKLAYYDEPQ